MLIKIEKSDFEKVVDFWDHFLRSFLGVDFGVDFPGFWIFVLLDFKISWEVR